MAKVRFSFGSKAAFDRMAAKDPSTVYFINETGDFSSASLDDDGDIYLGEKLLTGGGAGGAAAIPVHAGMPSDGVLRPNTLYQLGVLDRSISVTLSGDFDENVKNEWHIVLIPGVDGIGLIVNAPTIKGATCVVLGSVGNMKTGTAYDIRILYAGTVQNIPGYTQTRPPYKVFMVTYKTCYYL